MRTAGTPSTGITFSAIRPKPAIATSGGRIIGVPSQVPKDPKLVTVNVPPPS